MKKLACFLLLAFATVVFADKYDDWVNVDVKAIISKQEKDAFKKLKSPAEKDKFIQDFWVKRDPSPGTPENEFKDNYEKMLADVNTKIKTKSHKGAETDIGMTVLALGPPDDQKKEGETAKTEKKPTPDESGEEEEGGSATAGGSQKMTFIYKKLPPQIASGEVDIQFVADPTSLEWKFTDKKKAEDVLDKARAYYLTAPPVAHTGTTMASPQAAPAAAAKTVEAPVTTPELKAALDAAATGTGPKDITFNALIDGFEDSKGSPFVTTGVSTTGDMAAAKVGVRVLNSSGAVVKETEMPYVNAGEAAGYFQTEVPVPAPGTYNTIVAVVNAGKAGAIKENVKTPDTGAFSMSSVILANSFSQLTEAKPEGVAYTFGKIKVLPSVDRAFEKTAPNGLIIVYEAYNFQIDAATQKPNLEVVYQFQKGSDKPQKTPPAAPNGLVTGKKMTIPTSFPLTNFPVGNYKLSVLLTDKANGQTATEETTFTVK